MTKHLLVGGHQTHEIWCQMDNKKCQRNWPTHSGVKLRTIGFLLSWTQPQLLDRAFVSALIKQNISSSEMWSHSPPTWQILCECPQTFLSERTVFLREYHNAMYRVWIYFVCKVISEVSSFAVHMQPHYTGWSKKVSYYHELSLNRIKTWHYS